VNAVASRQDFAAALLDPQRPAPEGLRVGTGIDPQRRFAVHRNNAMVALVDALADAFPVTQALVGEEFFRRMARECVQIDPPRSPIIADYGDGFARFIDGFAPAAGVAYLADVARLERLRVRAFHAADAAPVALADYQSLITDPERLAATRLVLHPACGWLHSSHAVWSIWNAHQRVDALRDAELGAIAIDTSEAVLVTRQQWDVQVIPISRGMAAALDALREGRALSDAIVPASGIGETELAFRFESLLLLIVQQGLAVALDPPPE
jgi:hypothetical protein